MPENRGDLYFAVSSAPHPQHWLFRLSDPWPSPSLAPARFQKVPCVRGAGGPRPSSPPTLRPAAPPPRRAPSSSSSCGWPGLVGEMSKHCCPWTIFIFCPVSRLGLATVRPVPGAGNVAVNKTESCPPRAHILVRRGGMGRSFPREAVPGRNVSWQDEGVPSADVTLVPRSE